MSHNAPKISVLMPVHNAALYLHTAISSVLSQSFMDVELICIDDGSTDGSADILAAAANADVRLKVVSHTRTLGVGAVRNELLALAQGEYLLFLDSDDWLAAGALTRIAQRLQSTDADVIAFSGFVDVPLLLEPKVMPVELHPRYCASLWERTFTGNDVPDTIFQLGINLNNAVYRREFVLAHDLCFSVSAYGEWIEFVGVALSKAQTIALIRDRIIHIRWWHGGGVSQCASGSPDRCFAALQALSLRTSYQRSFVNFAIAWFANETKLLCECPQYMAGAKFLRVFGFNHLHLLGHDTSYYYDLLELEAVRAVVLGATNNKSEQLLETRTMRNKKLAYRVKRLKARLADLKKQLKVAQRQVKTKAADVSLKRAVASWLRRHKVLKGRAKSKPASNLTKQSGYLNYTLGLRFRGICEQLLLHDELTLTACRHAIYLALIEQANAVKAVNVYGKNGTSSACQTFKQLLTELANKFVGDSNAVSQDAIVALKAHAQDITTAKLKAMFINLEGQTFPSIESIYTAAKADSDYTAKVVSAAFDTGLRWGNVEAELYDKNGVIPVVAKADYDYLKESPDLMIVCRPNYACKKQNDDEYIDIADVKISGCRTVYAPYAFFDEINEPGLEYGYQQNMHESAWRIVGYAPQIMSNYKKYSKLAGKNVALLGAPRLDVSSGINGFRSNDRTADFEQKLAGRRTLLWNLHYAQAGNNWVEYWAFIGKILAFFEARNDLALIWRPHPRLFFELVNSDLMAQSEVDDLVKRLSQASNIILDQSEDYINAFALSHAMLVDGTSSLPYEYLATGKPVYLHSILGGSKVAWANARQEFAASLYYLSFSEEDLTQCLYDFASDIDPDKGRRMEHLPEFVYQFDGKTGERVKDYVRDEIIKEEAELAASIVESTITSKLLAKDECNLLLAPAVKLITEAEKTAERALLNSPVNAVHSSSKPPVVTALVLSNSANISEQNWCLTLQILKALHKQTPLDCVIHIGKVVGNAQSVHDAQAMIASTKQKLALKSLPTYFALGESETTELSAFEQSRWILGGNSPRYFKDIKGKHLRLIFLDSDPCCDHDRLTWLDAVIQQTPRARKIIIISSDVINTGDFTAVLDSLGSRLLAYIYNDDEQNTANCIGKVLIAQPNKSKATILDLNKGTADE